MGSITQDPNVAYIEFVGEERWATFGIFNGNAFPSELKSMVTACSTRAAMFLFHINAIKMRVATSKTIFIKQLESNFTESWTQGFVNTEVNRDMDFIVIYDGLDYLAAFYALLQSLKSLLDVYANLMGKLILPSSALKFSKAIFDGSKISGGKIAQWLENSAPSTFSNASLLLKVIVRHSTDWITQAVKYRDTIAHYADITGMKHMHVMLKRQFPPFDPSEIVLPTMPDSQPITDYCVGIVDKLARFLDESLKLLPNVNHSLVSFGSFALPQSAGAH
ncbi:MAG: hypothetical protein WCC06_01740 [Candidatus Aminicenantales bacterium]